MAKQSGDVLMEGFLGGIIYYKSKHGYLSRKKGCIDKKRIARDPAFALTRKVNTEFGYASRLGRLIRNGISHGCPGAENGDTNYRLTSKLVQIVRQDGQNKLGMRRLTSDNASLLEGFEWNGELAVSDVLTAPLNIDINPAHRTVTCSSASFMPVRNNSIPIRITHVQLILAAAVVDDVAGKVMCAHGDGPVLSLDKWANAGISMSCELPEGPGRVLVAGIGMRAMQEVNGDMMALTEHTGFVVVKGVMTEL